MNLQNKIFALLEKKKNILEHAHIMFLSCTEHGFTFKKYKCIF